MYPKGKPTDSIDLEQEKARVHAEQMRKYGRITFRTGPQFLVLLSLMFTFVILSLLGICYSCNRLNYLTTDCDEIRATVIDSSDVSKINMVFLWSEIEYEVGGYVYTEILKYTTTSTKVGDTVLVYFDAVREKAYNSSIYWFNVAVFTLISVVALISAYGYIYDFVMQGKYKRQMKKMQCTELRKKRSC